jgi:hypothetical protein
LKQYSSIYAPGIFRPKEVEGPLKLNRNQAKQLTELLTHDVFS